MKTRYGIPLAVILLILSVVFVTRKALFSQIQPPRQESPALSENAGLDPAEQLKRRKAEWYSKRIPHPACPNCFKIPGEFGISESVPGTEYIITRDLPDPAPLAPGEAWPDRHPSTGEPLWYKGNQAFVGPIDEAPLSASVPIPVIEVKRVMYRHLDELHKIDGVHGVGIGEKGILVSLLPEKHANRRLIPPSLEGVPVYVEEDVGVPTLN
jgi:hypothetical protein